MQLTDNCGFPKHGFADSLISLLLKPDRQSARMSKITNDGLTQSGTGCFIAVPLWQQWVSKG